MKMNFVSKGSIDCAKGETKLRSETLSRSFATKNNKKLYLLKMK